MSPLDLLGKPLISLRPKCDVRCFLPRLANIQDQHSLHIRYVKGIVCFLRFGKLYEVQIM